MLVKFNLQKKMSQSNRIIIDSAAKKTKQDNNNEKDNQPKSNSSSSSLSPKMNFLVNIYFNCYLIFFFVFKNFNF